MEFLTCSINEMGRLYGKMRMVTGGGECGWALFFFSFFLFFLYYSRMALRFAFLILLDLLLFFDV